MSLDLDITSINAGAVSERAEFQIVLTNSGGSLVSVTEVSVPGVENGLFISGQTPPFDLDADESTPFTLIVRPVGARFFSGTWTFQTVSDSVSATISGERKILWSFAHNWASPFAVTLSFKTDIFTSKSGKERRVAVRQTPRKSIDVSPLLAADDSRMLTRLLSNALAVPFVVEDPTRYVALDGATSGSSIEVTDAAAWIIEGAHLVVGEGEGREGVQIQSVDGTTVILTRDLASSHGDGDKVSPAWLATVPPVRSQFYTDHILQSSITFEEVAGESALIGLGAGTASFNGREVFPWPLNWEKLPSVETSYPVDRVDYGFGRTEDFHHVDFSERLMKAEVFLTGTEILAYEQFFCRMRGRAGEFYLSSDTEDVILSPGSEVAGTRTIRAEGSDLYGRLVTDSVHKAIEVQTPSGVERFLVQDSILSGSNTLLVLDRDWTAAPSTWAKISWLYASRFAGDDMTFEFVTDDKATVSVAAIALEDL